MMIVVVLRAVVGVGERAAGEERRLQRREVAGLHEVRRSPAGTSPGSVGGFLGAKARRASCRRRAEAERGGDVASRPAARFSRSSRSALRRRARCAACGAVVLNQEGQDVFGSKPGFVVLQRDERADHQAASRPAARTRARLRRSPRRRAASGRRERRPAAARAQHVHHVGTRGLPRRQDAEEQRRRKRRDRREREHVPIERHGRRRAAGPPATTGSARRCRTARAQAERAPPTPRARGSRRPAGARVRQRLPPIAARTASSRSRADARTSSRFATFAQAISSTNTTAPISASSAAARRRPDRRASARCAGSCWRSA